LAVSDWFLVITGLVMFWLDSARSYLPSLKDVPYLVIYTLPFGYWSQTCSVYIIVAAAIDCYIKVCKLVCIHEKHKCVCLDAGVLATTVAKLLHAALCVQGARRRDNPLRRVQLISIRSISTSPLFAGREWPHPHRHL
jgi:hypothetical protein